MLLSLQSIAQKKDTEPDKSQFKRLYIGDTVPMESIVFNNVRNYPGGKAKLSDFKGKYIILDFWDRGCTVCIKSFPHMEELQNEFNKDVQILLVTNNSEVELASLFKNSKNVKETKLPIVIGERILSNELFHRNSAPYHVWIDREGKVIASTYMDETNSKNLKDLIAGRPLNLIVRYDIDDRNLDDVKSYNETKNAKISLLKAGNGAFLKYLKYYAEIPKSNIADSILQTEIFPFLSGYSMFMDYVPNFPQSAGNSSNVITDEFGAKKGFRFFNMSFENLYYSAYGISARKIVVEGEAKSLYNKKPDTKRDYINNTYCYESYFPSYSEERAKRLLQQDLARFLGLQGNIEKRPIRHLLLTRLGTQAEQNIWVKSKKKESESTRFLIKDKRGYFFNYYSLRGLLTQLKLENGSIDDPVIIDATAFSKEEMDVKKIKIFLACDSLQGTLQNLPKIQRELANYGLGLREETRSIDVLVLTSTQ